MAPSKMSIGPQKSVENAFYLYSAILAASLVVEKSLSEVTQSVGGDCDKYEKAIYKSLKILIPFWVVGAVFALTVRADCTHAIYLFRYIAGVRLLYIVELFKKLPIELDHTAQLGSVFIIIAMGVKVLTTYIAFI